MGLITQKTNKLTELQTLMWCCEKFLIAIDAGISMRKAVFMVVEQLPPSEWSQCLSDLISSQNRRTNNPYGSIEGEILRLLERGLSGEPIKSSLELLVDEFRLQIEGEQEKIVKSLPYQALVPVLLLQFPGFLIINIFPIFNFLKESLE